jgi:plasmid maintenance system killer protein
LYVEYVDSKVKRIFEDMNDVQNSNILMIKEIGLELTKAVKKKYNQMIAFSSFSSLLESRIGKMEPLIGDKKGSYSLCLIANYRLIVAPNTDSRSIEGLRICDTIIIRGVMDYHGQGAKNNWIIP